MGIIIFAPWCMHHWASIITNASSHMHHSIVHGTFYLYSLAWWHCIGIKKHVLCNSSDNIILSKDIPKTPPNPSFRITFTCYPSLVIHEPCDGSQWHCFPRVAISALRGLDDLVSASFLALFDLFFLNGKSYITQLSILVEESCKNWVRMFLKIIVVIRRRPWLHVKNDLV